MTGLGKRLDALEAIAEQVRRREMRDLITSWPEAHDLTPAELEAATDEGLRCLDEVAELRRRGLGVREIVMRDAERLAAELGQTVAEVLAGAGLDPEAYR